MPKSNTFLSDYVWHVLVELCDNSKTKENSTLFKWNYINKNYLLDWNKIGYLFQDIKGTNKIYELNIFKKLILLCILT